MKSIGGRFAQFTGFLLLTALCLSMPLQGNASTWLPSVKETDEMRVCLVVQAIAEAIEGPSYYNLEVISAVLDPAVREKTIDRIREISGEMKKVPAGCFCFLSFQTTSVDTTADSIVAEVEAGVGVGHWFASDSFQILFDRTDRGVRLSDAWRLLGWLNGELSQLTFAAFGRVPPVAVSPITPRVRRSTLSSPNLFNEINLFDGYARFTRDFSYRATPELLFEGKRTFTQPTCVYFYAMDDLRRPFIHVMVSDPGWNRLISTRFFPSDSGRSYCQARGTYGQGDLEFWYPLGIAHLGEDWIVADSRNNRAQVFDLKSSNGRLKLRRSLKDNFQNVADVAAARFSDVAGKEREEIAVLDRGGQRVNIYDGDGRLQRTLCGVGSDPVAICYARSKVTHYPIPYLYVLDNGDKCIRLMGSQCGANMLKSPDSSFVGYNNLTAMTTDLYSNVYVVDGIDSRVRMFSPDLADQLASYGGRGGGDNELNRPRGISVADAWLWDETLGEAIPDNVGQALITEAFSDSTGIRRYKLGCDATIDSVVYRPGLRNITGDFVVCYWRQSGASTSRRKVYCNGRLQEDEARRLELPSSNCCHFYKLRPDDPDSAWYRFEIQVQSIYGTSDIQLLDSLFVEPRARIPGRGERPLPTHGTEDPAMPLPQITAEEAVSLAREYVIGADTVAAKAIKLGEPKLAPLPRDTNVPLDSLLFPDLLLDRPAWAIDMEGFRPVFWKDLNPRRPLPPDKGTVYIDAETGRLLKVMLVDAERFEPTTDTAAYSLISLVGAYQEVNWFLSKPTSLTLATVLSRGDLVPPYGALAFSAYFVETEFPEGYEPWPAIPRPGEPLWMIGIKWRLDVPTAAPGAMRPGLVPGWTFYFLKEQMGPEGGAGGRQLSVPKDWW